MYRHRCRGKICWSTANMLFFVSGVIFCFSFQLLVRYAGDKSDVVMHRVQTANNAETLIVETVVQRVKEKSRIQTFKSSEHGLFSNDAMGTSEQRSRKWKFVVVVMSAPTHIKTRKVIRQTWALTKPNNTAVYFAVGVDFLSDTATSLIKTENNMYGDLMLLEGFKESYINLTQKLVETLKWVDKNLQLDYLMKVDEDSFVRLDEVVNALDSKPKQYLYWGYFNGVAPVKTYGKWAESNYFLCDNFLPYAVGGGYVISSDIVHYLAINSEKLLIFNNEDVSMGTWLAPLKINRIHDPDFNTESVSRGCFNSYLVSHPYNMFGLLAFNRSLRDTGHLCVKERFYYKAYMYDWNVPPRYCCDKSGSSTQ